MNKQLLTAISPATIELGPINFDLFTPHNSGRLILFCRKGFEISERHMAILANVARPFYISGADAAAYVEYTFERLERIINNPEVRVSDKAEILHQVGKRCVGRLLKNPTNPQLAQESGRVVGHYVDLILNSPEAAANMFALSSLDAYTFSHSINVMTFNLLIAQKMFGTTGKEMWHLGMAGLLHDIGKTQVDDALLFKKGPLSDPERQEIRKHVIYSEEIIRVHGYGEAILKAGRNHHEKWCGGGYPDGLVGTDIHLFARITAVSDVYDALTSNRVYKEQIPHLDALKIMADEFLHYDPEVFNVLLSIVLRHEQLVRDFKIRYQLGNWDLGLEPPALEDGQALQLPLDSWNFGG